MAILSTGEPGGVIVVVVYIENEIKLLPCWVRDFMKKWLSAGG